MKGFNVKAFLLGVATVVAGIAAYNKLSQVKSGS